MHVCRCFTVSRNLKPALIAFRHFHLHAGYSHQSNFNDSYKDDHAVSCVVKAENFMHAWSPAEIDSHFVDDTEEFLLNAWKLVNYVILLAV